MLAWLPYIYLGSSLILAGVVFTFGLDGLHVARVVFMSGLVVVHLQVSVNLVYL